MDLWFYLIIFYFESRKVIVRFFLSHVLILQSFIFDLTLLISGLNLFNCVNIFFLNILNV